MSKIGKSTVSLKQTSITTRSSTAAAAAATTTMVSKASAVSSIVSINVNNLKQQAMSTFSLQSQANKKKRMALENITNGTTGASTTAASSGVNANVANSMSHAAATATGKEVTKKYRVATAVPPPVPFIAKKPTLDLALSKKTTAKLGSKENLASINRKKEVVPKKGFDVVTASNLNKLGVSKSENDIKKQVDLESRLANTSLTASEEKLNEAGVAESKQSLADQVKGWEDIDANDKEDEFTCSEYVTSIFKYYRQRECKFQVDDYLTRQRNITKHMRTLLVDWMVEVQQQLEFNHEVLYLSVKLVDLYLNSREIERDKLQLLAGAAMFIGCKFEERMPPIIDDFIFVSDNAYDRKELIKMEIELLRTVKFDLGAPLSYTFLRRYSKCIRADMKFLTLARYILELSLQDYQFAYEGDSLKACAALYLAVKMAVAYETNNKSMDTCSSSDEKANSLTSNLTSTDWNATLIHYTGAFLKDFQHLLPLMNNLIKSAPSLKQKTILKKYSHQVFYEVAKIPALSDEQIAQLTSTNE